MPAKVLYEQEGLTVRKNGANDFCVIRLHYTADPNKRSAEWKKAAMAGMRTADFNREYEIDYTSVYGEPIFPEFNENMPNIIQKEPYPEFGPHQTYWGGLDYGARNPSSVHFYTIYDQCIYVVWELYHPCKDPKDFVKEVKSFPFYNRVQYIAADPSVFSKTTRDSMGMPASMAELFLQHGLHKLMPGNTNEAAWIAKMHELWQNPDDPLFKIYNCCPNMIREFQRCVFATMSSKLLTSKNYQEKMADKDNHALDDCKYFINSRPKAGDTTGFSKRAIKMVDWYK
jgi:hypothetical protein